MGDGDVLISEAVARSGLSRAGVRYAILEGLLPARRLGRYWVIRGTDLDRWLTDPRKHQRGKPKRKPGRPRKIRPEQEAE